MTKSEHIAIAILVPCLALGGAERQISLIAPRLVEEGYDVTIISMISPLAFADEMDQRRINVLSLDMQRGKYTFKTIFKLITVLRKNSFKVLITFNYPANIAGRFLKLFFPSVKLITSIRSPTFGSSLRTYLMKFTKSFDDATVVNSNIVAKAFLDKGIVLRSKLRVILNAVIIPLPCDRKKLRQEGSKLRRKFLGSESDYFIWIAVGRHESPKDYEVLLQACTLINPLIKKWVLLIIGDGSLKGRNEDYIRMNGLEKKVFLVDGQENIFPYYYAADAYVSSSAWEGMPNTVVEAMVSRCPVIATRVGEVPNIIEEGVTGLIVKPKSSFDLAEAMKTMMSMDTLASEYMKTQAEKAIFNLVDLEEIAKTWAILIKECYS